MREQRIAIYVTLYLLNKTYFYLVKLTFTKFGKVKRRENVKLIIVLYITEREMKRKLEEKVRERKSNK